MHLNHELFDQRLDKWIGQNHTSNMITFSERFMAIDYTYHNNSINEDNILELDTGIYLTKTHFNSRTFKQLSDIGKYIKFLTDRSLVLLFIGLFSFYFAFFSIYFDTSFRNLEFYKHSIFSFYKEFLTAKEWV